MGNGKIYLLTNSGNYKLRIEMRSRNVGWVSAEYSYFSLENETNWVQTASVGLQWRLQW